MRFISDSMHAVVDYLAALFLIIAPFVLGFEAINPIGHWFSVAAGVALFGYSLLTRYSLSIAKIIPFGTHLIFDTAAGVAFIAAPFLFGFEDIMRLYYFGSGGAVLLLVLFTIPQPSLHAEAIA